MLKNIIIFALILIGVLFLVPTILLNNTGGISGAIKIIGIGAAVLAFAKPKLGIYIVAIEVAYLDYFKKLGTYYGAASQSTVIEILAMSMLAIGALWVSILLRVAANRRGFKRHEVLFILMTVIWGAYSFFSGTGLAGGIQTAVNGAGIFIIALVISSLYDNPLQKSLDYTRHVFWILIPWCLRGLYQYHVGYSDVELWYSETGFSTTNIPLEGWSRAKGYRLSIGFGSGKAAYGIVGALYGFALWHVIIFKKNRFLWSLGFLISFWASLAAISRTQLVLPILIFIVYFIMKKRFTMRAALIAAILGFISLVFASDYLVANLARYDEMINIPGMENTARIQTLSPRLKSLADMTSSEYWSITGIATSEQVASAVDENDQYYSHSVLSKILIVYGGLGISILVIIIGATYIATEKALFSTKNYYKNIFIRYGGAKVGLVVALSLFGGSNFHTQPGNLFSTAMIAMVLCSYDRREHAII